MRHPPKKKQSRQNKFLMVPSWPPLTRKLWLDSYLYRSSATVSRNLPHLSSSPRRLHLPHHNRRPWIRRPPHEDASREEVHGNAWRGNRFTRKDESRGPWFVFLRATRTDGLGIVARYVHSPAHHTFGHRIGQSREFVEP
jgi:hypothetical protein